MPPQENQRPTSQASQTPLICQDLPTLAHLAKSVVTWLSDYGTEVGMARVGPVPMREVFPYMATARLAAEDNSTASAVATPADEIDFAAAEPVPQDIEVDFSAGDLGNTSDCQLCVDVQSSLEVPGLLHIISNAGKALAAAMVGFDDAVTKLMKVSNLLASKEHKDRLYETCFSRTPAAQQLFEPLWRFDTKCHLERWGTVSHCVVDVLDVEAALRHGWDLDLYLNGSQNFPELDRDLEANPDNPHKTRLDLVDEAIRSPCWWGYITMLSKLAVALNVLLSWAESCSCHWDLVKRHEDAELELPGRVRADIYQCPLRGRRCADLAAGEFMALLKELCEESVASIMTQLPPGITQQERCAILSDFERGRMQLVTQFTIKLAHYEHVPYSLFGLAHRKRHVRAACFNKLRNSEHPHPKVTALQVDPLLREGELYAAHDMQLPADTSAMPAFRSMVAKLRLALCAERVIEAPHARTKREVQRCPNHSEALTSLAHRMASLEGYLGLGPEMFAEFALALSQVKNGRRACELLGLHTHPAFLAELRHPKRASPSAIARSRIFWKIIYHNDALSKYSLPAPSLNHAHGSHGPGAPVPGHDDSSGSEGHVPAGAGPGILDNDDEMLRRACYAQHVLAHFSNNTDVVYSMPLAQGTIKSLEGALGIKQDSSKGILQVMGQELGVSGRPTGDDDAFVLPEALPNICEKARNLVFFRVVGGPPSRAVRTKLRGQSSLSGTRTVSVHRLLQVDLANKELIVSLTPLTIHSDRCGQVPLLLNTQTFSRLDFKRIKEWQVDQSEAVVGLQGRHRVSEAQSAMLPRLLSELSLSPSGCALDHPWVDEHCREVIAHLERDGLIEGPPWRLTLEGRMCLEVGAKVSSPRFVVRRPEPGQVDEADVAQLICELDAAGWRHAVVGKRRAKEVKRKPYVANSGDEHSKVWYTKRHERQVSRFYLLALLKAVGETSVPHLANVAIYKQLLCMAVPIKVRKRDRQRLAAGIVTEVDWPEDAVQQRRPAPVQRARRRRRKRCKADSSSGTQSSHSTAEAEVCQESAAEAVAAQPATRSSSDSSSSSSSSSTSSASVSSSTPAAQVLQQGGAASQLGAPVGGQAEQPESQPDTEKKRPGKGYHFGANRITEFKGSRGARGFQLTCSSPLHKDAEALCTKSRTERASEAGSDLTLRMLMQWSVLGATADVKSKAEHQDLWKRVEAMASCGGLPSVTELDNQMPATWDHVFRPAPVASMASSSGQPLPLQPQPAEQQELGSGVGSEGPPVGEEPRRKRLRRRLG